MTTHMSPQSFRTKAQAQEAAARLKGWHARPVRMLLSDGSTRWVVECDGVGAYRRGCLLRRDGYIR